MNELFSIVQKGWEILLSLFRKTSAVPRRLRAALFGTQAVLNRGTPYSTTKATSREKVAQGS